MLVETYEVGELTDNLKPEVSTEMKDLIDKLGLDAQQKFFNEEKKSIVPYRKMTQREYAIFHNLCPQRTEIKKYGDEPIPVRVLQVAAHAKDLDFFDEIMVWHPKSADIDDPVLVGHKKEGYTYTFYILARWGKVLESLDTLAPLAMREWRQRLIGAAETAKNRMENEINQLKTASEEFFLKKADAQEVWCHHGLS